MSVNIDEALMMEHYVTTHACVPCIGISELSMHVGVQNCHPNYRVARKL
jgi:hypothetical protein